MLKKKKKMICILLVLIAAIGFYCITEYRRFKNDDLDFYVYYNGEENVAAKESVNVKYDKMESKNCMLSNLYLIKGEASSISKACFRYLIFSRKVDIFRNTGFIVRNSNNEIIDRIAGVSFDEFFGVKTLTITLSFDESTYIPYYGEEIQVEVYTSINDDKHNASEQDLVAFCKIKFPFLMK